MDVTKIRVALDEITFEQDATVKCLKLASLCSALWQERGAQLVVVGGSAIEILTEGAYVSGDLDLCYVSAGAGFPLGIRERQEVMGLMGAVGGPRNWQIAGMYVDLLGLVESLARTPFRRVAGPYGEVLIMKPEDLLAERVLVSVYPGENMEARACAKKLISVILQGAVAADWQEVRRIANLPEYRIFPECVKLVIEVARELNVENPLHPD